MRGFLATHVYIHESQSRTGPSRYQSNQSSICRRFYFLMREIIVLPVLQKIDFEIFSKIRVFSIPAVCLSVWLSVTEISLKLLDIFYVQYLGVNLSGNDAHEI